MVHVGLYRYCRNPMIAGIFTILAGEAIAFRSLLVAGWLVLFVVAQNVYIIFDEEPALRRRFGPAYDEYCRHVPRWLPRRRPYLA
jgi:protein-S-isoprenylcysteine O-methyltransferase Ste14